MKENLCSKVRFNSFRLQNYTYSNSNSVAQQPRRTSAYCVHLSIRDHWTLRGEQMSRSGGQSEVRSSVLKSPSKLGTHLLIHCSWDERLSRPCHPGKRTRTYSVEARYATTRTWDYLYILQK
ncbi:hypothetical protein TNCV_1748091 [Trichonephila clavipes]|nr:hypothetical protein TNCV_1748091 [Trichonephila clavipes]